MKVNVIGVASALIAFISLVLPWWTISVSFSGLLRMSFSWDVYTWGIRSSAGIGEAPIVLDFAGWYRYVALAMVVAGAIFGLAGSVTVGEKGRTVLAMSGILTILAAIIFVLGLATDPALTEATPPIGIFESKDVGIPGFSYSLSAYLHIGFFLAVIAAILAFISLLKHPMVS